MPIPFIRNTGRVVPYATNAKTTQELPRGMVYRELFLRLTGAPTLAGASNTAANTGIGDEWAVVKTIELRLDGKDIIKRIDGPALRWLDYYKYGVFPLKNLATLGDGATANPSFDSTMILPLWMPKSVKPMDFALDTRLLSRLDLDITWGTFTDVNTAATAWTTQPALTVYSNEVTHVQGNFARWNVFPVSAALNNATKQQIKLPVGYMYRSFLVADPSGVLTAMRFKAGALTWLDVEIQVIRDIIANNRRASNIAQGILNNTAWRIGATNDDMKHFFYIDMVNDGYNSESIDTFGMSEAFIEADTNGAGTVTIYPSQLVVPRVAQGGPNTLPPQAR